VTKIETWSSYGQSQGDGFWQQLFAPVVNPFNWFYQHLEAVEALQRAALGSILMQQQQQDMLNQAYSDAAEYDDTSAMSTEQMLQHVGCNRFKTAMNEYMQMNWRSSLDQPRSAYSTDGEMEMHQVHEPQPAAGASSSASMIITADLDADNGESAERGYYDEVYDEAEEEEGEYEGKQDEALKLLNLMEQASSLVYEDHDLEDSDSAMEQLVTSTSSAAQAVATFMRSRQQGAEQGSFGQSYVRQADSLADVLQAQMEAGVREASELMDHFEDSTSTALDEDEDEADAMSVDYWSVHSNPLEVLRSIAVSVFGPGSTVTVSPQPTGASQTEQAITEDLGYESSSSSSGSSGASSDPRMWGISAGYPGLELDDAFSSMDWRLFDEDGNPNWGLAMLLVLLVAMAVMLVGFVHSWMQLRSAMGREVVMPVMFEHGGRMVQGYVVLPMGGEMDQEELEAALMGGKGGKQAGLCVVGALDLEEQDPKAALKAQEKQKQAAAGGVLVAADFVKQEQVPKK